MNIMTLFDRDSGKEVLVHVSNMDSFQTRTHNEVMKNVNNLSSALRILGMEKDDKILILSGNIIETIECILSAFSTGIVAVPVSPNSGVNLIKEIIVNMEPKCCVFDMPLSQELRKALEATCKLYISVNPDNCMGQNCHSYNELLKGDFPQIKFDDFDPDQIALVIHSSGSTGVPKAIYRTHENLFNFIKYNNELFSQYYDEDQIEKEKTSGALISTLPLSHLSALGYCFQGLFAGVPVYLLSHFEPRLYLKLMLRIRCNLLILVPSMYELLLKEKSFFENNDYSFVKFCLYTGDACSDRMIEKIERTFKAISASAYGLTECLTGIGHSRGDLVQGKVKKGSCGTQLFGECLLVDEKGNTGVDLGELWIKNPTIPKRYLNGELNEAKVEGGWFKTGDLLFRDPDGHFFYKGRRDDMFICNGNNIYPAEIERMLINHPLVESVCAVPIKDMKEKTVPAVMIKQKTLMTEIKETEIINFSIKNGPAYAIPQFVKFAENFPLIGPGKVNRPEITRILQHAYDNRGKASLF